MEQAIEKKDSEKESKADVATINDNASVEDSPQTLSRQTMWRISHAPKAFREMVEFDTQRKFNNWLRSGFVKPYWMELWEECLKNLPKGTFEPNIDGVLSETASAQKKPKKDWTFVDHLANFHFNVKCVNTGSPGGIFFEKNISESRKDLIIWCLKPLLRSMHAPGAINKSGRGAEIFDLTVKKVPKKRNNRGIESRTSKKQKIATNPIESKPDAAATSTTVPGECQVDIEDMDFNEDISGQVDWPKELQTPQKRAALLLISDSFDVDFWKLVLLVKRLIEDIIQPSTYIPEALQPPTEKQAEMEVGDSDQQGGI